MNTVTKRAYVLLALVGFMAVGLIVIGVKFSVHGEQWATMKVNAHLYNNGSFIGAGTVYDRNGTALIETVEGERTYNNSARVRKSTLHILGDDVGFIGNSISTAYSSYLSGYNRFSGLYTVVKNGKGNDITLTLDADVSAAAIDALGTKKGAVAVCNYKTGEIICSVSTPTFDVRSKPKDIDSDTSGKYEGIYLNRVTSGLFTPGSVFKIVTAICAEENGYDVTGSTFTCTGEDVIGGVTVTCPHAHGTNSFTGAFADSCNCAFARVAAELGAEKLAATATKLGFNTSYSVGKIVLTKSTFSLDGAQLGDVAWAGVGQYTTLVNPLHYLMIVSSVANGGVPPVLTYVKAITDASGKEVLSLSAAKQPEAYMSESTASAVAALMRTAVTDSYGEKYFRNLEMCGKTGTAEVGGDKKPHAWFVGFSRNESCPYAIVVVVENGGWGADVAIPVAGAVMNAVYKAVA